MRRITILLGGLLLIVMALPLLPGPGWLTIARVLTVLEREFVWVHSLLNRLESGVHQPVARSHALDSQTAALPRPR